MPQTAAVTVRAATSDTRIDQLVHALQRSSSSANHHAQYAYGSQSDAVPAYAPRSSSRPERLGEDYRRMPDRLARRSTKVSRL
jgi:hypothetical protein